LKELRSATPGLGAGAVSSFIKESATMNLSQAQALLAAAAKHYPEKTVFDIGARGHFENPTTELLAFFFDPEQVHDLGDCFLHGLLDCLPGGETLPARLIHQPCREVPTTASDGSVKFMDLVLHGEGWGVLLENKIYSPLDNPLATYEAHFNKLCKLNGWQLDDKLLLPPVLLSPLGSIQSTGWTSLAYAPLVAAIRKRLQGHDAPASGKWRILANEFLLHLENLAGRREMDDETFDFAIKRLVPHMRELNTLHEQAIKALDARIVQKLQEHLPDCEPDHQWDDWPDGPALRYSHHGWNGDTVSEVVLYLSIQKERLLPLVRVYLVRMTDALEQQVRKQFGWTPPRYVEKRTDGTLWFEWSLGEFEEQTVVGAIAEKMKAAMEFEDLRGART